MKITSSQSILATVLYGDIFSWPLTKAELQRWAIGRNLGRFPRIPRGIEFMNGFYIVKGNKRMVFERLKKEAWAKEKWNVSRAAGLWFRLIPTIELVGVTGGLSRNNVNIEDDIDLFCVTQKGTIWITRLLTILLMELLRLRRKPGEGNVKNKLCLNMFMSADRLRIDTEEQDLFSAYEVLQMQPLWDRNNRYAEFLESNQWVKTFLPNAWQEKEHQKKSDKTRLSSFSVLSLFEPVARTLQLWYMERRRTNEVIRPGLLRFHPKDARVWVKEGMRRRFKRFNLPLDKIFYDH